MPSTSLTEAEIVQNTALSATMIWQCGIGYQKESDGRPMDMHVAFLVLPTCLHRTYSGQVTINATPVRAIALCCEAG